MISRSPQRAKRFYQRWLARRIPPAKRQSLNYKSIFVFPTKEGFIFIAMAILMWLLGTNYQNNLVLACSYLLLALMVVSMSHAYHNLAGLEVLVSQIKAGFSQGQGQITLQITAYSNTRYALEYYFDKDHGDTQSVLKNIQTVRLSVPLKKRGWQDPGRLTIVTRYPLGLIKAWSHVDVDSPILAYPKPIVNDIRSEHLAADADSGSSNISKVSGISEFAGVRNYQLGDSPNRIAWKHYSRTEVLVTKEFEDQQSSALWLSWFQFPNLGKEERLSYLSYCVGELSDLEIVGLELPGIKVEPGSGPGHRQKLLTALAIYE